MLLSCSVEDHAICRMAEALIGCAKATGSSLSTLIGDSVLREDSSTNAQEDPPGACAIAALNIETGESTWHLCATVYQLQSMEIVLQQNPTQMPTRMSDHPSQVLTQTNSYSDHLSSLSGKRSETNIRGPGHKEAR